MKKALLLFIFLVSSIFHGISQVSVSLAGYPIVTTGWTVGGTATTVDSEIQLTTSAGSENGYVYYNTAENVTACGQFTVDFDYKISGAGGSGVADGIAFYFINPLTSFVAGGGLGLPNPLTGFVFTMDTWDNDGDGLNPEDQLFGYSSSSTYSEGDATHLLTSTLGHQTYMADGSWHHVRIAYFGGTIRVYVNGSTSPSLTGTFPITTSGYFGFSAATGGGYSVQCVKSVYLNSNTISSIIGTNVICQGSSTPMYDSTAGGTWSSSNSGVASVGASTGVVYGASTGTAVISYSYGTSCVATLTVNVVTPPSSITGTTNICMGLTTTLSDVTSAGTWSSGSVATATVNPTSGVVTGLAIGSAAITYSTGGACYVITTVNVTPQPAPITGITNVCTGFTTALSETVTGGAWSSSATAMATVNPTSGLVAGLAPGVATIAYTIGSCLASVPVTVNLSPSPITGTKYMCTGFTTLLGDVTAGGSWSSVSPGIASIGSSTGVATGIAALGGTSTIKYTLPGGCYASAIITVNPLPATIASLPIVCVAASIPLYSGGGAGAWTSSDTTIAAVDPTGSVTGIGAGSVSITYTLGTGCYRSTSITVLPLPGSITGDESVCAGSTTTLVDSDGTGGWSSVQPLIAAIDIGTGVVSGYSPDTVTIVYTSFVTGCAATAVVTVSPIPSPISGIATVCEGATTSLYDLGGGAWSIGPASVASITPATGLVTGIAHGPAIATYTMPSGCSVTAPVSVNPVPGAIIGPSHLCVGQTATLTDPATGGTWTSSNTGVAPIGPTSGSLLALFPGTTSIVYSVTATGCTASVPVTINSSPGVISGPSHICFGTPATFSDGVPGGTWAVTPATLASIGSASGALTSASGGVATITYSLGVGCSISTTLTINTLPSAITGSLNVCVGAVTVLSDGGGGSWTTTSANVTVGPGAGVVTGAAMGAAVVTYILPTTCSRTTTVNVNPVPFSISGPTAVCIGSTIALTDGSGGGTWSSSPASIASVGGFSGTVTGVASGTSVVSYVLGTGCYKTMPVVVNALPGLFSVTGGGSFCAGGAGFHVYLSGSAIGLSYQLYNGTTTVGAAMTGTGSSLDFGLQTAGGSYTVVATDPVSTCSRTMTGAAMITVNPLPLAITGPTALCVGATIGETDGIPGGTWTSSLPSIASVGASTGVITGHVTGSCTVITYTLPTSCAITATVCVSPSPGPVSGVPNVCIAGTDTLTDIVPGGSWASSSTSTATVGSLTGIVTGVSSGPATITYSLGTGCTVTKDVTVNPAPAPITGTMHFCAGSTSLLANPAPGGIWSDPAYTAVATVAPTGLVTGMSGGVARITYNVGCPVSATVTVDPGPSPIAGVSHVCVGLTTALSDLAASGTWSTSATGTATIDATGLVTGIAPGTAVITYSTGVGCVATTTVAVGLAPAGITGTPEICVGQTTTLSDLTASGTWGTSSPGIASVSPGGVVLGISAGVVNINYTVSGCDATKSLTVNPLPLPISGIASICQGLTTSLSDATGGGVWSSGAVGTATIDSVSGLVSGIAAGVANITYTLGTGCLIAQPVSISAAPTAITGTGHVCIGSTTTLSDVSPGGTWISASPGIADIGSSTGVVTGSLAGTAIISYSLAGSFPGGCPAVTTVTVNTLPAAIGSPPKICLGLADTLTDATGGGIWTSGNLLVATIDAASGVLTGSSPGTVGVSYSLGVGCTVYKTLTVNPAPPAITGPTEICSGATATLADPSPGGSWSTGSLGVATVGASSGIVTGLSGGVASIHYLTVSGCVAAYSVAVIAVPPIAGVSNLCAYGSTLHAADSMPGGAWTSTLAGVSPTGIVTSYAAGMATLYYTLSDGCFAMTTFTVNPLPAPISGNRRLCYELTTDLTETTTGGTWTSSDTTIAKVLSGVVSGITAGVTNISYTLPTGCAEVATVTVSPLPFAITGADDLCAGNMITLSNAVPGGSWSVTGPATIGAATGVLTGVSAGIANVIYTLGASCTTNKMVTVNSLPVPYAVTGGGNFCSGAAGVPVGLGGSQSGEYRCAWMSV